MILIKISRRQRIELIFLLGRFPQEITRDRTAVLSIVPASIYAGIPSQLQTVQILLNKASLDVKVARAEFFLFGISAVGYNAFLI
jgi:hypothetical protein